MLEPSVNLLELHPDRALLPANLHRVLRELNLDPLAVVPVALELARIPAGLSRAERADFLLVLLALLATQGQGHTRMPLEPGAQHPARLLLAGCQRPDLDLQSLLADPRLEPVLGAPGAARPLILEGGYLCSQRQLVLDTSLAETVRAMVGQPVPAPVPVPEPVFHDPVVLNGEQRAAVNLALGQALTLITGGPGTGKTSIVAALLRGLLHQPGLDLGRVALAAPTGKAAQRMGEALRTALAGLQAPGPVERALQAGLPEPQTLHRLLAWHQGLEQFRHGSDNPLPAQVVIVDEASMVSVELMARLFQALAPGTRLVLLGDAQQLPSVDGGSAFRDLLTGPGVASQGLTENYRMRQGNPAGRNILSVAQALQRSGPDCFQGPEAITVLDRVEQWQGRGVELVEPGPAGPQGFLVRWFEEVVLALDGFQALANRVYGFGPEGWSEADAAAIHGLLGHGERFRILAALREAGDLRGVVAINELLHGWMFSRTGAGLRRETPFYAGEPVLMTGNDYRRGLFNGDQGLVLKVDFAGELRQAAVFPGPQGPRAFALDALRGSLELCYAMTVHKAQGSEYDRIAILLPRGDHPALTRELLYTAVTRARSAVTLVGEAERVLWAAGNPSWRDTGLGQRL